MNHPFLARAGARRTAGFTLIELMIAVAIVGILAAIALGQYRDYTRRARMSEALTSLSTCKTRVGESYVLGGEVMSMRDALQLTHVEETGGLDREIQSPHGTRMFCQTSRSVPSVSKTWMRTLLRSAT